MTDPNNGGEVMTCSECPQEIPAARREIAPQAVTCSPACSIARNRRKTAEAARRRRAQHSPATATEVCE